MNLKEVFKDALSYPFTGMSFLTVFLLFLGSFLLIPGFIARGYELRVIKRTISGSRALPDFGDSGDLITQGLKYIAASIIYGIPTYILMFAFLMSRNPDFAINGVYYLIISVLIGFLISIIFVISLSNMVVEDRFWAVFDFRRVFELIKSIGWGWYIISIVIYTVIVQILSLIMIVFNAYLLIHLGYLMGLLCYYVFSMLFSTYLALFSGRLRGLIYSVALQRQENEDIAFHE